MLAIYKKELRSYFINPLGYVFLGIFLAFSAFLCCYTTIISATYSTANYFVYLILSFIILIPILTMRLFAEERKMKTEQLLLTAPVSIPSMVLGKYFAALTIFVGGMACSFINFLPLYVIGASERGDATTAMKHIGPVTGEIFGGMIAAILLGASLIALGTLISALSENQLSAAVVTVAVIAVFVLLNRLNLMRDSDGQPLIKSYAIRAVIDWISVLSRFMNFINGIFDYAALLYYVSLAFIFLFLTVRVYERRRLG